MKAPSWAGRAIAAMGGLAAIVFAACVVVEYRQERLAALEAGGAAPGFLDALGLGLLLGGLERAAIVLALSAMVPVCIALIGGPRKGTAVAALTTWAISAVAMLAVLFSWTRPPA